MTAWRYQYSGIRVASELPLPEWAEFASPGGGAEADAAIRLAGPCEADEGGAAVIRFGPEEICLRFREVGRFRVRGGREIEVAPARGADPAEVRLFLLGSAWGALCYQRGWIPFHASVVRAGDGAVAFCAPSGGGKSSLAAWLVGQGHALLSDDLCRLDPDDRPPRVWRSALRLKLWSEALDALSWPADGLPRDRFRLDKYHLDAGRLSGLCRSLPPALDLRAVYVLAWGPLELTRLTGSRAVRDLVASATYRPEFLETPGRIAAHWLRYADLARHVPVYRLSRPRNWARMAEAGRLLAEQWKQEGWT